MLLLPRDDERGQPGKAPMPLKEHDVERMYRSWEELGYSVQGFDLVESNSGPGVEASSQTKGEWPEAAEMDAEMARQDYKVVLPDLNGASVYSLICPRVFKHTQDHADRPKKKNSLETIRGRAARGKAARVGRHARGL